MNESISRELDDTRADTPRKWSYAWWIDEVAIDRWTNEGGALRCSTFPSEKMRGDVDPN
jgi:hypothetical protein